MRSGASCGNARATVRISVKRSRSGFVHRPSVPSATLAPAASNFGSGCSSCHAAGAGGEKVELAINEVVAVNQQRAMRLPIEYLQIVEWRGAERFCVGPPRTPLREKLRERPGAFAQELQFVARLGEMQR
jgi:hypothetical protein